jgi:hypothetical protein
MLNTKEKINNNFELLQDVELNNMENRDAFPIDSDLPSPQETQKLLAKLDDKILSTFAREALPESIKRLDENNLTKIHEIISDWIATFEEYATPDAVDKIVQAAKDIEAGQGIPWEEVKELVKMG